MIVKTVGDLHEFLNNFEDNTAISIRVGQEGGYYQDREVQASELYPYGSVSFTAGANIADNVEKGQATHHEI